jgi:hypothetical protein
MKPRRKDAVAQRPAETPAQPVKPQPEAAAPLPDLTSLILCGQAGAGDGRGGTCSPA